MKIYEVKQRSLEWHDVKWGKIGGSTSEGLFKKTDTLFLKILSEHLEENPFEESYINDAMQRGIDLEPSAIQFVEQYTGYKFDEFGFIQSDQCEILGISPDGLTSDMKVATEVKCLSAAKHTKAIIEQQVPSEYVYQCIHYFTVIEGLEKLYFCCYRPESVKNLIIELTPESIVNIGTKARPKPISIQDATLVSLSEAIKLNDRIKETIEQINF